MRFDNLNSFQPAVTCIPCTRWRYSRGTVIVNRQHDESKTYPICSLILYNVAYGQAIFTWFFRSRGFILPITNKSYVTLFTICCLFLQIWHCVCCKMYYLKLGNAYKINVFLNSRTSCPPRRIVVKHYGIGYAAIVMI